MKELAEYTKQIAIFEPSKLELKHALMAGERKALSLQDVYTKEQDKQAGTVASNMLQGIEQSIELTTLGNTSYVSRKLVNIEVSATKQLGLFFIASDSHSWNSGQYAINIDKSIVKI
ncbi:hypothetical protein PBV87_09525 [Niameybacter massiliensis]|uniref:Uncharacterized protein n=1 Tax=Holtiella tumoricola TaxID=3018743 RepID=A0AA42J103_9FIRM|nr:hypothetical protein [Holtiella tumoricola]MDA3731716.1 hypothetical protein [Holtiella tumoricola]